MDNLPIIDLPIWTIAKGFVIFAIILYLVFAFVVIKQVRLMTETLEIGFEAPIRYFAYLHFLFALGILLLTVIIL